tara:strand:+ start:468 stop:998 length:531 start_codon:yes stop_codon:yes gene_type:complete
MQLKSLQGCRLKIGTFSSFHFNAYGGGGVAKLIENKKNNTLKLSFSSKSFFIPSLNWQTTRFLYVPLPPGLKIDMFMEKLEGTLHKDSGEVLLNFKSKFILSIVGIIKFPDLFVNTLLQTGIVKGKLHEGKGINLQKNGRLKLVGIAVIPKTGNKILDTFLSLPNEALAELQCELK